MRITKDYDERKNEILDAAERLFNLKGYDKCTVNDIIKEVSIAKGTFYHYFNSKEEVLDGVISRFTEVAVSRAESILEGDDLSTTEKLLYTFMAMQIKDKADANMLDQLHKTENALLHQKTLNQLITAMAPILVKVVEEGIEKGEWDCKYPLQYMQIFLAASLALTDDGVFELEGTAQMQLMAALVSVLEKMLEVPEDTLMSLFRKHMG